MNIRRLVDRYFIKNPSLRRRVTKVIEGDRDLEIQLFGVNMQINSIREHGYLRASRTAKWSSVFGDEAPVLLTIASLLPHIDTVVDAGANVGLFSCTLAKFQGLLPNMWIVAFEADPETFQRLRKNLQGKNQTCENVALAAQNDSLTFIRGAVSHVTTKVEQANAYSLNETFSIDCRRLDSFQVPGKRLLIKIDVEGQELQVLQGAESWFRQRRCAAVYLDGFECRDEVFSFLAKHDFEFRDGRTLKPATKDTFSLLALHKEWLAHCWRT